MNESLLKDAAAIVLQREYGTRKVEVPPHSAFLVRSLCGQMKRALDKKAKERRTPADADEKASKKAKTDDDSPISVTDGMFSGERGRDCLVIAM